MRLSLQLLGLVCLLKCFLCQDFTFGGGSDEEEEEETPKPDIVLSRGNNETITMSEMQYLHVTCDISNFPQDKFSSRWVNSEGNIVGSNRILYIKSLLKSNEGRYNCSVENKTNPSQKFTKYLDLKVTVPSISIKILPTEYLKIGGKINRQCSDLDLPSHTVVDTFTYNWLNEQNKVVGHSSILDLSVNDGSVAGTYTCQYKSADTSKIYEAKTTVDLNLQQKYDIRIIQDPKKLKYNERLSMICEIQPPHKNVTYEWFKNEEPLKLGQELIFDKFNKYNVGEYKCKAFIMLNSGVLELQTERDLLINMDRKSKIELKERPGDQAFVHFGEKKEIHCEIETNSNFLGKNAIWYINGTEYKPNSFSNVRRLDRQYVSMLVINNINHSNEGMYECLVGDVRKEANVTVVPDVGRLESNPSILKVNEGQLVEFHCLAENFPNVLNHHLKWTFESKDGKVKYQIVDGRWTRSNPSIAEQTSFIDLVGARLSDSGYYICTEPNGAFSRSELIVIPNKESNIITITPKEIRVRSGQKFEIDCYSKTSEGRASGQPYFLVGVGKSASRDNRFEISNVGPAHIRLTATKGLTLQDNEMNITCASGLQQETSKVFVKDVCPPGYRYCQNGQCLENAKFCDKVSDCTDGSDENPIICRQCDPISRKCENHNGEVPKKSYYLVHWICDGEDDCGNGYDEVNCGEFSLDNCGGKYSNCSDGTSIPRGYVCDQLVDCSAGDDEIDCKHPDITKTSDTSVSAVRSQQVVLTCEAHGKPLPTIVWRFNWGCIQNSSRFSVSFSTTNCNTVSSTLTINDFQPGDDGIYNCEAISSRQRAFSNDFQVSLKNN